MSLFEELKRRNVFRVGIAYAVASWLVLQLGDILLEAFDAPDWSMRLVVALLLLGLPIVLFLAWAFELTPEGIKKESEVDRGQSIVRHTGRKLDLAVIAILVLALGYFVVDKFMLRTERAEPVADTRPSEPVERTPAAEAISLPTDKSIAVLPFENRSNLEEDAFFTSGIHDDLLTQLAQISSLRVISRTSVSQFADTNKSIREIAGLLNVSTILEGGVQRAGNQVRINMQLIDAATDAHLWAQTFDRELTANNIFAIQSEVATAVTDAMRATLTEDEVSRIAQVPTENMQALEEYFKGRAEMDNRSKDSIQSARLRFEQARRMDPEFAQAWASEAQAILLLSDSGTSYGDIPAAEVERLARPLMERAYELAPTEPMVLAVYGLLENQADNFQLANEFYDRSLAIEPNSGEVMNWKRLNLLPAGRTGEAQSLALRMIEADPMSRITLLNGIASIARFGDGTPDLVDSLLDRLDGIDPVMGLSTRQIVANIRGQAVASVRYGLQAMLLDPGKSNVRRGTGFTLAELGLYAEARNVDPAADEYIDYLTGDWEENLRRARETLARSPDSLDAKADYLDALYRAGQIEEAIALGEELWAIYGNQPDALNWGGTTLFMAEMARRTERPAQASTYRNAYAAAVQQWLSNDWNGAFLDFQLAALAAYDNRDAEALAALERSVDNGLRQESLLNSSLFERLSGNLQFQTVIARMRELAAQERSEVLDLLCGPDQLEGWDPAPDTCTLWAEGRKPGVSAPI
jgi:TolB-like protein